MAFKDILVHLDATPRSDLRLALACDLVKAEAAHTATRKLLSAMTVPVLMSH